MERFRPLIAQSSNFVDPLSAHLDAEETAVAIGVEPIVCKPQTPISISLHQEDHFSVSPPGTLTRNRMLSGSLAYSEEWAKICTLSADPDTLISLGRSGELRACRFRAVCWMVYLGVLPKDHTQWLTVLRRMRENYEAVRLDLMVTPGLGDNSVDPLVNNPLSQDENSSWNQYFEDSELKKMIRQDVVRTFPEVEFFKSQRIRDLMVTVLFCYARQHPDVSYKQGMHEILAPLVFVLHCDHQAHQHANEMDPTQLTAYQMSVLQEVMDEAYLEYDAFALFEGVMHGLEQWYIVTDHCSQHPNPRNNIINAQPFARPQDSVSSNLLVQKLYSIHDGHLQRIDPQIYNHLTKLEIAPQIYGIRWVRLLFGREFALQDLLMVWDAIFADTQNNFPLVDFLTIAMLLFIKEPILSGDYTTCLKFLMRYPASADVQYIIQLALHLRNPKTYPKPRGYSNAASHHVPTVGGQPNVHRAPQQVPAASNVGYALPGSTRSASLPRTQYQQKTLQQRAQSTDQTSYSGRNGSTASLRRLSSPNVDPLNATAFKNEGNNNYNNNNSNSNSSSGDDSRTSKMVSGFVRFKDKLGRPKDLNIATRGTSLQSPPTPSSATGGSANFHVGRTMSELSVVRSRSVPLRTRHSSGEVPMAQHPLSSDDSDEELSTSMTHTSIAQNMSKEDLCSVLLGCSIKLSQNYVNLKTRLEGLHVLSDASIQASLNGINEVIETLSLGQQLTPSNGMMNGQQLNSNNSSSRYDGTTQPEAHSGTTFRHPLSDDQSPDGPLDAT